MIKEKRPENPVWRGVQHYWRTDEEGNEIMKEEKHTVENEGGEKKKKRGRPKGSKNKKKEEKKKDLTIEEITELLEKKKKEREEAEAKKLKEEDEKVTSIRFFLQFKMNCVLFLISILMIHDIFYNVISERIRV